MGVGTRKSSLMEQRMILGSKQSFRLDYCIYKFKFEIVTELRAKCGSVASLM